MVCEESGCFWGLKLIQPPWSTTRSTSDSSVSSLHTSSLPYPRVLSPVCGCGSHLCLIVVCAGWIAAVVPLLNARARTRARPSQDAVQPTKALCKEEIELGKLFPQKEEDKSGWPFISSHRVSSGPTRSLHRPLLSLSLLPPPSPPPPVTSHVWTDCDHPGRPGVRQLQVGVSVRGGLECEPQQGGHHGVDPGSGRGEVRPQN